MSKDINIESYDGSDAFYSGTDEEYEEFLKNADIKIDGVEPVENTQKINLNETINIQSVIDRFRKTAGGIESGAKKIKDTVTEKIDLFKTKKDDAEPEGEEAAEAKKEEPETEETAEEPKIGAVETVKETIKKTADSSAQAIEKIKAEAEAASKLSESLDDVNKKIELVQTDVSELSKKMDGLSEKINAAEAQLRDNARTDAQRGEDIKRAVEEVRTDISEIKQTLGSVSKLSDSIFDLKNAQLNTKNALSDLETGFKRLKKKCVMGVTVLSVLSAIIIVLEVILMLS
ncbi:MAG: hypothetical protein LUF26_08075 [Firmicutes bacterium]|nr:hypothetical protein [Bacillota bacterium]